MSTHDHRAIDEGLAALAQFYIGDATLHDALRRVVDLSAAGLGADIAGVTIVVDGKPTTAVYTEDAAPRIDAHQYESGLGPCVEAFRERRVVRIDSVAGDERYPEFEKVAYELGVRSTLSLPLVARGEPIGALNLYARRDHAFPASTEADGAAFARQAAAVLANARVHDDARELNENLRQALASRATIDQAVGIVMSAGGRSPEEAFQVLVRASQRQNRKLRDIAGELVERAQRGPRRDGPVAAEAPTAGSAAGPAAGHDRAT